MAGKAQGKEGEDLPKGWKEVSIGEIADVVGGGTPSSKVEKYWHGAIPWLTPKDLSGYAYRRIGGGKRNISPLGLKKSSAQLLPKDTVLVTSRAPIGYVALADGEVTTNQGFRNLILNTGYDPEFFYYLIKHNVPKMKALQTGSTFGEISGNSMKQIRLKVPPLSEQRRIAGILGSLDDKIELNRRMSETLEAMSQAVFKSWFVDFDPVIDNALAAGNEIPSALQARAAVRQALGEKSLPSPIKRLFPAEFESTAQGPIPKGWKITAIENAMEINPSIKLKKDSIAPYVDMKGLPTKGYSINGAVMKPYSGGSKFQNGDVLLARITPCLENGKTAVVDFLEDNQVGFGSTEFIVLRGKESIGTPFVACLSRDQKFRDHCVQHMAGTSGRQRVHNSCFSSFYMALPEDKRLLEKYHSLGIGNFEQMTAYGRQIQSLSNLRDMLLPKLLLHG